MAALAIAYEDEIFTASEAALSSGGLKSVPATAAIVKDKHFYDRLQTRTERMTGSNSGRIPKRCGNCGQRGHTMITPCPLPTMTHEDKASFMKKTLAADFTRDKALPRPLPHDEPSNPRSAPIFPYMMPGHREILFREDYVGIHQDIAAGWLRRRLAEEALLQTAAQAGGNNNITTTVPNGVVYDAHHTTASSVVQVDTSVPETVSPEKAIVVPAAKRQRKASAALLESGVFGKGAGAGRSYPSSVEALSSAVIVPLPPKASGMVASAEFDAVNGLTQLYQEEETEDDEEDLEEDEHKDSSTVADRSTPVRLVGLQESMILEYQKNVLFPVEKAERERIAKGLPHPKDDPTKYIQIPRMPYRPSAEKKKLN